MDDNELTREQLAKLGALGVPTTDAERRDAAREMVAAAIEILARDFDSGTLLRYYDEVRVFATLVPTRSAKLARNTAALALAVMFFAQFRGDVETAAGDLEHLEHPERN